MGYNETGANGGITYASEKTHCVDPNKFMMGMLGSSASWLGNTASQQIDWILNNGGGMGIGIWDANLGSAWQTADIWNKIKTLKQRNATPAVAPVASKAEILDKIQILKNTSGGIDFAINLREKSNMKVMIYDTKGSMVTELYSNTRAEGKCALSWNGSDSRGIKTSHGSYVLVAVTNGNIISKQFVLIR
jgi:hypothetical protein